MFFLFAFAGMLAQPSICLFSFIVPTDAEASIGFIRKLYSIAAGLCPEQQYKYIYMVGKIKLVCRMSAFYARDLDASNEDQLKLDSYLQQDRLEVELCQRP